MTGADNNPSVSAASNPQIEREGNSTKRMSYKKRKEKEVISEKNNKGGGDSYKDSDEFLVKMTSSQKSLKKKYECSCARYGCKRKEVGFLISETPPYQVSTRVGGRLTACLS